MGSFRRGTLLEHTIPFSNEMLHIDAFEFSIAGDIFLAFGFVVSACNLRTSVPRISCSIEVPLVVKLGLIADPFDKLLSLLHLQSFYEHSCTMKIRCPHVKPK